jgi:hypothetical protein
MKKALLFLPIFFVYYGLIAQERPPNIYPNGLIYSEESMSKLKHIVDSLNLKFKTSPTPHYYAQVCAEQPFQQRIPYEYARMIQYADCMMDTTAPLFLNDAEEAKKISKEDSLSVKEFSDLFYDNYFFDRCYELPREYIYLDEYVRKNNIQGVVLETDSLFMQSAEYKAYLTVYQTWETELIDIIKCIKSHPHFDSLKNKALEVAFRTGYDAKGLESYIENLNYIFHRARYDPIRLENYMKYLSDKDKKIILQLKRNYTVEMLCGIDPRPPYHLQYIAILSVETDNWTSFLKAHLEAINQYYHFGFPINDYTENNAKPYLRELEELGLDIPKLLIGICLTIDKSAKNRYSARAYRIAKALANKDVKYTKQIETLLLKMIQDPNLDGFNRYICFNFLDNYISELSENEKKDTLQAKLKIASKSLPAYILKKIEGD